MASFSSDELIGQYATELIALQPPMERLGFKKIILESINDTTGTSEASRKGKLVEILYTDMLSKKKDVDFSHISDTKGNITAFTGYELITRSLEILNNLFEGKKPEEYMIADKLHKILVAGRGDFEFGFKFDIELIMLTYNTLVLTLIEVINICILKYVDYLKSSRGIDYDIKLISTKDLIVIKTAKSFITAYEKGEWKNLVMSYRRDAKGSLGAIIIGVPLALIAIFFAIRQAIYVFYAASANLSSYMRTEADFIAAYSEREKDKKALDKQKRFHDKLVDIANFINIHILKTEAAAKQELEKSNVELVSSKTLDEPLKDSGVELF